MQCGQNWSKDGFSARSLSKSQNLAPEEAFVVKN